MLAIGVQRDDFRSNIHLIRQDHVLKYIAVMGIKNDQTLPSGSNLQKP